MMHKFLRLFQLPMMAAIVASSFSSGTRAAVTVVGDVLPSDNVATPAIEGIPSAGSGWNALEANNAQSRWENNTVVPGYEDIQAGIVVGQKFQQGGRLEIDTSTALRYQTLVIGDQGEVGDQTRLGTGTVLITGIGAIYSNVPYTPGDPTTFPPNLPPDYAAVNPRAEDFGFDLFVGRYGQGRITLRNGGRAEIQDAVVVGDQPGSSGVVEVDGFGSLLSNGGFEGATGEEPHQMLVGRQGIGEMNILNGGLVVSEAPRGSTGQITVGAAIGSDAFVDNEEPELGGTGHVTVTGFASRWIVGGSLQVGGFHNASQGLGGDIEGDNVIYNGNDGQAGRGTLTVGIDALVEVRAPITATTGVDEDLLLAIGRFGTVDMQGGLVVIGSGIGGQQSEPTPDEVQLLNDGLIQGFGRIETGVFRNRYFGQVRVGLGESLIIDSTSEFTNATLNAYPLSNFGLIELIGTLEQPAELEFVRPQPAVGGPLSPFINRPVETVATPAPTPFDGGLISAEHGTLRFHTGIQNEGSMIFSDGVNRIGGRVDNVTGIVNRNALVYIGPETTVVADSDFSSGGFTPDAVLDDAPPILSLQRGSTLVVEGDMALAGFLDMELSLTNPSTIQVAGDLGVNATLFPSFDSEAMSLLSHGDAFELMYFARDIGGVDSTDPARLTPDLTTNPTLNVATDANFDAQFPTLDLIAMPILQSYYLFVLDPALVGGGATGSDFNGDGVVDAADLAIWQTFKGLTTGASVLQGDADLDGDVDGEDYLLWLEEFTDGVPPSPPPSGSVPEPAGLALIAIGAMLALGLRPRSPAR
jgi:T5SS/PEP-CTERM-associated repeat protein